MDLVGKAYSELYSEGLSHSSSLRYSKRLKHFNARVRISQTHLSFILSHKWKTVSEDIQIGLIQSLLTRVFKKPRKSWRIDLYHNFVKKLHLTAQTIKADPELIDAFNRVNSEYFYGLMDMPNLIFGKPASRTLGSYDFHTNTIRISPLLRKANESVLDYIVYHELLHKKLKFTPRNLTTSYHSKEFKTKEKEFQNAEKIEKEIKRFLKST